MGKPWKRPGEEIGAGFFVFRRGKSSGRIARGGANGLPYEHPTIEAAQSEAARLAEQFRGETFAVFQQVDAIKMEPENG